MRVSGFTIASNLSRLNYPLEQSICSILPFVDEMIVNVGLPDGDGTAARVRRIGNEKIRIVENYWNNNFHAGGYVLAQQTNIALFNCSGDWAFYIQADEIFDENCADEILDLMRRFKHDDRIEGIRLEKARFRR